jgi:pimeloyl-ACP methyl ester carboxylesterase
VKPLPKWFRILVRVIGSVSPGLMTVIAYRMFWDLGTPMALRPEAAAVHARARRENVTIGGRTAVVYRWGSGPQTVLLVHGWRGRAAQFAAMVEALESPDRTIVAFDAPGNGDSPGSQTDLRDYIAVIRDVAASAEGLDLIVAHSFGVLGMFVAVREGARANRIVSIAGMSTIDYTYETFVRALELPRRADALLRARIVRRVFSGDAGMWRRFVAELDPTDRTPLMIIHDRDDRAIEFAEAHKIADAHCGPANELFTSRLGHVRVLSDPIVLSAIATFAGESAPSESAANESTRTRSAAE